MMNKPIVPLDDLLDVSEMTQKLENYISHIIKDSEVDLGMSALISATINSMLANAKTFEEIVVYRNVFMEIFDSTIKNININ